MAIIAKPPIDEKPEPDVAVEARDAEIIRRVAIHLGKIEAIVVTRWLTKASLKASKDFVESLTAELP